MKLAVLGSTRGTTLQYIIDAIENKNLNASIEIVISNKSDAFILQRAKTHSIQAIFIDSKGKTREEFDLKVMKILEEKNIDLVLLIGYMRLISNIFIKKWPKKILNVHPSLLPKFAGGMDLNVHQAVLDANEQESGMTIHYVDQGIDTGEIILQKKMQNR